MISIISPTNLNIIAENSDTEDNVHNSIYSLANIITQNLNEHMMRWASEGAYKLIDNNEYNISLLSNGIGPKFIYSIYTTINEDIRKLSKELQSNLKIILLDEGFKDVNCQIIINYPKSKLDISISLSWNYND